MKVRRFDSVLMCYGRRYVMSSPAERSQEYEILQISVRTSATGAKQTVEA